MTIRDEVAKVLRDGTPRTAREIVFEIYGPMSNEDTYTRIQCVAKGCRQLTALGMVDMIGKMEQVGQYVKVYQWRAVS